jgi:hypothetical protein
MILSYKNYNLLCNIDLLLLILHMITQHNNTSIDISALSIFRIILQNYVNLLFKNAR